jgi:hypothetical protein
MAVTFVFYVGVGFVGYAALGDATPGNILTGFNSPKALVTAANAMVLVHMVRAAGGVGVGGGRKHCASLGGATWQACPNLGLYPCLLQK